MGHLLRRHRIERLQCLDNGAVLFKTTYVIAAGGRLPGRTARCTANSHQCFSHLTSTASNTRMFVLALGWNFIYPAAVLFGLWFTAKRVLGAQARLPLPPGPPGHWLFGNKFPNSK